MRIHILIAILLVSTASWALDDNTWIRTYAGGYGHSVYETPDGGAILGGTFGPQTPACCEPWLIKLAPNGAVEWQVTYDAAGLAGANNIVPTRDGGYVLSGEGVEFLVVKVAADGAVQWAKNLGDGGFTFLRVLEADTGNILVTGASRLGDNSLNGRAVLLDPDGNLLWQRVFGSFVFPDFFAEATQAYNGNFIVAGSSIGDYWVMELDAATGDPVWQNIYGGPGEDTGLVISRAMKRRYVMVGASETFTSGGLRNWWVVILNQSGKIWKQFSIGGIDAEDPHSVIGTSDGGFMVAGGTGSFGSGFSDIWVVKFDAKAEVEWQKTYGLPMRSDSAWQIEETENGYAVIGDSFWFPVEYEIWLMTLDKDGNIADDRCGIVRDSDAVPYDTIGATGPPRTVDFGATAKAVDLKVVATSQTWPIETCAP
jgi:hypothetical protein